MASISNRLAKKLNLEQHGDIIFGRANDIFFNVRLIKAELKKSYSSLIERLLAPKYETAHIEAFAYANKEVDLKEINGFIEENYFIYMVDNLKYRDNYFTMFLSKNDSININPSYIADFLTHFSSYLQDNSYYSACHICKSNDNISCIYMPSGRMQEICETCRLKNADM